MSNTNTEIAVTETLSQDRLPALYNKPAQGTGALLTHEQLGGLIDLTDVAFQEAVRVVERTHRAIANEPFEILQKIPVTAPVSEVVRQVHEGVTELTYSMVKGGGKLATLLARGVVNLRQR